MHESIASNATCSARLQPSHSHVSQPSKSTPRPRRGAHVVRPRSRGSRGSRGSGWLASPEPMWSGPAHVAHVAPAHVAHVAHLELAGSSHPPAHVAHVAHLELAGSSHPPAHVDHVAHVAHVVLTWLTWGLLAHLTPLLTWLTWLTWARRLLLRHTTRLEKLLEKLPVPALPNGRFTSRSQMSTTNGSFVATPFRPATEHSSSEAAVQSTRHAASYSADE